MAAQSNLVKLPEKLNIGNPKNTNEKSGNEIKLKSLSSDEQINLNSELLTI